MTARQVLMGIATFCLVLALLISLGTSLGTITVASMTLLAAVFVGAAFTVS